MDTMIPYMLYILSIYIYTVLRVYSIAYSGNGVAPSPIPVF